MISEYIIFQHAFTCQTMRDMKRLLFLRAHVMRMPRAQRGTHQVPIRLCNHSHRHAVLKGIFLTAFYTTAAGYGCLLGYCFVQRLQISKHGVNFGKVAGNSRHGFWQWPPRVQTFVLNTLQPTIQKYTKALNIPEPSREASFEIGLRWSVAILNQAWFGISDEWSKIELK